MSRSGRIIYAVDSQALFPYKAGARRLCESTTIPKTQAPKEITMPRPNHPTRQQLRYRRLFIYSIIAIALVSTLSTFGCGKMSGGSSLHVKSATTGEKDLVAKSGYAFAVTKSFTDINGKI